MLVNQEGYTPDVVEAALAVGIDDLIGAVARVKALAAFKARPDFESVAGAFKRVANIIKEPEKTAVNAELFQAAAEQSLLAALASAEQVVTGHLAQADYGRAFEAVSELRGVIDAFFDSVLVMDQDEAVRRNRLALLTRVHQLFSQLADFRKIQIG